MQTYRTETIISENGTITIHGVPFCTGDRVEIIILDYSHKKKDGKRYPLRGKPIRYDAPFDSVADDCIIKSIIER
jgi:hypothetical protein